MIVRSLISFLFAAQVTMIFYRDLFLISEGNALLFLIWGAPCLHLLINFFLLIMAVMGSNYRRYKEFGVVRTLPIYEGTRIGAFSRLFVSVNIEGRERILSSAFWGNPKTIVVYKSAFGRFKILSPGLLAIRLGWIIANIVFAIVFVRLLA